MVATLYHHDDVTGPPFVVLTPHEARHYSVEPILLGCNGDVLQARDRTLPGAVTTISAEGSTSVVLVSIASTRGVDLG